jgi:DNA-binding MarR family transcriptional regulator
VGEAVLGLTVDAHLPLCARGLHLGRELDDLRHRDVRIGRTVAHQDGCTNGLRRGGRGGCEASVDADDSGELDAPAGEFERDKAAEAVTDDSAPRPPPDPLGEQVESRSGPSPDQRDVASQALDDGEHPGAISSHSDSVHVARQCCEPAPGQPGRLISGMGVEACTTVHDEDSSGIVLVGLWPHQGALELDPRVLVRQGLRPHCHLPSSIGIVKRTYVSQFYYMIDARVLDEALHLRLAIGQVARRLRWVYARRSAQRDIGFLEAAVLVRLDREGPSSPSGLASSEGITSQAVSMAVAALAAQGLVSRRRDEKDGRRVVLAITEAGQATLRHSEEGTTQALATALMSLSAADRSALAAAEPALVTLAGRLHAAEQLTA